MTELNSTIERFIRNKNITFTKFNSFKEEIKKDLFWVFVTFATCYFVGHIIWFLVR